MQYQSYLDLSQVQSVEALRQGLVAFAHHMDFGLVSAALVLDKPGGDAAFFTLTNAPAAHEEAFLSVADSKRDPVLKRLKRLSIPFFYDQALYVREHAADLWEEQAQHGYRTGVSVALHLPDHAHFLLGVDRDEPLPSDGPGLTRLFADLQLLAVHAQHAATHLLRPPKVIPDLPPLTPREMECLHWTYAGKTTWEIGQILGISESGAGFHIRSIIAKFGCSSKHQAVLLALRRGLL